MEKYFKLIRLDKPAGIFLLFWPCAWGLVIANSTINNEILFYKFLILFFLGSVLMRSAGCVYNDIIDQKIDQKVKRTSARSLATGSISISQAWFVIFLLIFLSLIILL